MPNVFSQESEVKIKDLINSPNKYVSQQLTIVGTFRSLGSSAWTGDFVVADKEGNTFPVSVWVPYDIAPSSPGTNVIRGPIMADYVGKLLKLGGKIRLDEVRSERMKKKYYFLDVSTATELK